MSALVRTFPLRPFVGPGRVLFGAGASRAIGAELVAVGGRPANGVVVLVADAALLKLDLVAPLIGAVQAEGFEVRVVPGVDREPTPATIAGASAVVRGNPVAAVIGIGGGSALDAAKLVAAALTNDLELQVGLPATAKLNPTPVLLAVPTTAGTGAEATAVAMLWHNGRKRIFVNEGLVPRHATLDPTLMQTLAAPVIAASGLDAISHAVESLLSTFRTPMTIAAAESAIRRLARALPKAYADPDDDARAEMLLGAHEAGLALNASVVSGHSIAYAIASRTGLPHGVTCAMALPYCLAYSRSAAAATIAALGPLVGVEASGTATLGWLNAMTSSLGIPVSLDQVGITERDVASMAKEIAEQYPRPNSPAALDPRELELLLTHFRTGDIDGAWDAFGEPIAV